MTANFLSGILQGGSLADFRDRMVSQRTTVVIQVKDDVDLSLNGRNEDGRRQLACWCRHFENRDTIII